MSVRCKSCKEALDLADQYCIQYWSVLRHVVVRSFDDLLMARRQELLSLIIHECQSGGAEHRSSDT